jgi:hypothetical protein
MAQSYTRCVLLDSVTASGVPTPIQITFFPVPFRFAPPSPSPNIFASQCIYQSAHIISIAYYSQILTTNHHVIPENGNWSWRDHKRAWVVRCPLSLKLPLPSIPTITSINHNHSLTYLIYALFRLSHAENKPTSETPKPNQKQSQLLSFLHAPPGVNERLAMSLPPPSRQPLEQYILDILDELIPQPTAKLWDVRLYFLSKLRSGWLFNAETQRHYETFGAKYWHGRETVDESTI